MVAMLSERLIRDYAESGHKSSVHMLRGMLTGIRTDLTYPSFLNLISVVVSLFSP